MNQVVVRVVYEGGQFRVEVGTNGSVGELVRAIKGKLNIQEKTMPLSDDGVNY